MAINLLTQEAKSLRNNVDIGGDKLGVYRQLNGFNDGDVNKHGEDDSTGDIKNMPVNQQVGTNENCDKKDSKTNSIVAHDTEEMCNSNLSSSSNRISKLSNNLEHNGNRKAGGYLIAVHRKLSRQDTYFLSYHKSRPSLFGVPLLIPCYENGTNKDLYCAVWIQVARLLSPLPSTPPEQSNHATDW